MACSSNNLMNVELNTAEKTVSNLIDTNLANTLDKVTNLSSDGKNQFSRRVSVSNDFSLIASQEIPFRPLENIAQLTSNGEVCNTTGAPSTNVVIVAKDSQILNEKTVFQSQPARVPFESVSREPESSSTLRAQSTLTASPEATQAPSLSRTNSPGLVNVSASRQLARVAPTFIANAEAEHSHPASPDAAALDLSSSERVPTISISQVHQLRQAIEPQASTVASPPAAPRRFVSDSPPTCTRHSEPASSSHSEADSQALLETFANVLDAGIRFSRSPYDESSTDNEFDRVFEGLAHATAAQLADPHERRVFTGQNLNKTIVLHELLHVPPNAANCTQQRLTLAEETYHFIGNPFEVRRHLSI